MRLQLSYPAKPFKVTQGWGVPNDAYLQFGFSKHNGIDFTIEPDGLAHAMCDGIVMETGNIPSGAGNYVKYRTDAVECEGTTCHVWFYYMHAKEVLVKAGEAVKRGQALIVADNTGFSTGPHTHISAYRYSIDEKVRLDLDPATNFTFDWSKYLDGTYADGTKNVFSFERDMTYGETSPDVVELQLLLQRLGYFPAKQTATGYYGSITQGAVFQFQKDYVAPKSFAAKMSVWLLLGKRCGPLTRPELNRLLG